MIAHVVLLRPRPGLSAADRTRFHRALAHALEAVSSVRRFRVGRRVRLSAAYEAGMTTDYQFFAMIEFDDRAGLEAYLAHPAHDELGRLFYGMSAHALAYDYEVVDRGVEAFLDGQA